MVRYYAEVNRSSMTILCSRVMTTFANGLAQPPHLMVHVVRLGAAKTNDETLACMRSDVSSGERP